jgi:hypothetical protein
MGRERQYIFYVIQCCDLHYLPVWKRAWLTDKTLKNTDTPSFSACSRMYFLPEYLIQNLVFAKLQYQTEGHSVYYQSHCIKKTRRTVCAGHLLLSEWNCSAKYEDFFLVEDIPLCLKYNNKKQNIFVLSQTQRFCCLTLWHQNFFLNFSTPCM